MNQKPRLVVIGNGMAGMRAVEELLKLAPDLYEITVFGAEPHGNYNRILLSPVLAGETTLDEIMLNSPAWYAAHNIRLHAGDPVVLIDRPSRQVVSASGRVVPYDRLLLATGSRPFIIPVPGCELPGVVSFRDIQDVESMLTAAHRGRRAVVIGGGLLGLEAATGRARQGMEVSVVHRVDSLMERQLDPAAAELLRAALAERGLNFALAAETDAILGDDHVRGIRLKDGREIAADLVVMAVGIRPNITLARAAGLHCERGIVVNDALQSFDPRIYAVGECVQHRQATYGLVAPLWEQARVCANHLAQLGYGKYLGSQVSTRLKVTGIDLFSAGEFNAAEGDEEIVFRDLRRGVYKKLVLRGNRIAGAVLYGDVADGSWYYELMLKGADVSEIRDLLVFGKAFAETADAA